MVYWYVTEQSDFQSAGIFSITVHHHHETIGEQMTSCQLANTEKMHPGQFVTDFAIAVTDVDVMIM